MDIGGVYNNGKQITHRIDNNVTFSALDLFVAVDTAVFARVDRFYALRVDYAITWGRIPSRLYTVFFTTARRTLSQSPLSLARR